MNDHPRDSLLTHLTAALHLADSLALYGVAIDINRALVRLDPDNSVLKDSAERIWRMDDQANEQLKETQLE